MVKNKYKHQPFLLGAVFFCQIPFSLQKLGHFSLLHHIKKSILIN